MNKIIIDLYDTLTTPIAMIGYVWYLLIETPVFVGRMKAHNHLAATAQKSEQEQDEDS